METTTAITYNQIKKSVVRALTAVKMHPSDVGSLIIPTTWVEPLVYGLHALYRSDLPLIHEDPFEVLQQGITLLGISINPNQFSEDADAVAHASGFVFNIPLIAEERPVDKTPLNSLRVRWKMYAATKEAFTVQAAWALSTLGVLPGELHGLLVDRPGSNIIDVALCGQPLDEEFVNKAIDLAEKLVAKHEKAK